MRILRLGLMPRGVFFVFAAVGAGYWVAAFGGGMNTTGCRDIRIPMPWEDPELFGVLGPFFVLGVVVFVLGKWVVKG